MRACYVQTESRWVSKVVPAISSYVTIHDSTARYRNPARQGGAFSPLAWRVLIERAAGLSIPIQITFVGRRCGQSTSGN